MDIVLLYLKEHLLYSFFCVTDARFCGRRNSDAVSPHTWCKYYTYIHVIFIIGIQLSNGIGEWVLRHQCPYCKYSVFVCLSEVARLLAVYVKCLQPPPALRSRTSLVHNPSNTRAHTVYFKSPA